MLEALLGAIFLDAGFEAAAAVVERLWGERLGSQHRRAARRPRRSCRNGRRRRGLPLPAYRESAARAPTHAPVFVVEVTVKGHEPPAQGRGLASATPRAPAATRCCSNS